MGREIRRVPPNWQHPVYTEDDAPSNRVGQPRPCHDTDYPTAAAKWKRDFAEWEARGPIRVMRDGSLWDCEFWEYDSPPDPETCRPAFAEEPTWWQVYETVSEGTPVSPAFETKEALIDYLAEHGDFWAQHRGDPPPSREVARRFVEGGWAPSAIVTAGRVRTGIDSVEEFGKP